MKTLVTGLLVLLTSASVAYAQDDDDKNEYRPHYTWNFRYPRVIGQDDLADQSSMVTDFVTRGLDYSLRQVGTEETKMHARQRLTVLTLGALIPLVKTFKAAGHEMAHLREWSKAGIGSSHFLYVDGDGHSRPAGDLWEMAGNVMAHSTMGFDGAAADIDDTGFAEFMSDPKRAAHLTEFTVALYAGGLNHEQYQAERMADRVLEGKAIFLDLPLWFYSLISVMDYQGDNLPGNDIGGYVDWLKPAGIRTSEGSIRNLQWMRFANGSSVAMLYGLWRFFKHCDRQINPLPIPFPEFASYLSTESGPTFKVRLPVRLEHYWDIPLLIEPSYQTPIDRGGYDEFGLRARYQVAEPVSVLFDGYLNSSGGSWIETGVLIRPCQWFEFNLGFNHGNGYTFQRDINGMTFAFLTKQEWSAKLGLGLIFRF